MESAFKDMVFIINSWLLTMKTMSLKTLLIYSSKWCIVLQTDSHNAHFRLQITGKWDLLERRWHEDMYQVVENLSWISSGNPHVYSCCACLTEWVGELLSAVKQTIVTEHCQSFQLGHCVVSRQAAGSLWRTAQTNVSYNWMTWKGKHQSMDNTKNRKKKEETLTKNEEVSRWKAHAHKHTEA